MCGDDLILLGAPNSVGFVVLFEMGALRWVDVWGTKSPECLLQSPSYPLCFYPTLDMKT